MTLVRFVLAALKPGVTAEDYERFEREVDYVVSSRLRTIVSYRTHRITEPIRGVEGGPWDYIERIEITDRQAYERELADDAKAMLEELYARYLDRSKTVSIWTERIEP